MKTITSHWFSMLWTTLVMLTSIVASIYTRDPMYVARAGALVTLSGIFMTTRRLLVSSSEKQESVERNASITQVTKTLRKKST